jgi:hypothetical protein
MATPPADQAPNATRDRADAVLEDLARRVQRMQDRALERAGHDPAVLTRGLHAKGMGVRARLQVDADLPERFRHGLFRPGAEYAAIVRFSNARGEVLGDLAKDQRGIAVRVKTVIGAPLAPDGYGEDIQDFLGSSTPVSFARSATQFIEVGEILLLGAAPGVVGGLVKRYGPTEALRILKVFFTPLLSLAPYEMHQYWSRTSFRLGDSTIRYLFRPVPGSRVWSKGRQVAGALQALARGRAWRQHYLRETLLESLRSADVGFEFCIQAFVDEARTPVEDASVEWPESIAPPVRLATLTIPRQSLDPALQASVERMAFSPWFRYGVEPIGLINLARKRVYEASAAHRGSPAPNPR